MQTLSARLDDPRGEIAEPGAAHVDVGKEPGVRRPNPDRRRFGIRIDPRQRGV